MRLEGIDERGRPVVSALVGVPAQRLTWAIQKNGEPADPKEPVRKIDVEAAFGPRPGRVV